MIKKIITSIINIILSSLISLLILLLIISSTILNKKYLITTLEKNKYYEKTENRIKEEFSGYAPQLHINDEEINLDDICTKKMIKDDINNTIDNIYNNKEVKIDKQKIIDKLTAKINELLNKHHRITSLEEEKSLENWKNIVADSYQNEIIYTPNYINLLPTYHKEVSNSFSLTIKTIILIISILILLLSIIGKNIKEIINNISISLLTTSFILILLKIIYINAPKNILVLSERASEVISNILTDIINISLISGIIIGIISLIALIIGVRSDNTSETNKKGKTN